ncbi:hypothetical protein KCU62_g9671, partial [Aureobasidium sp. EXF-3399]
MKSLKTLLTFLLVGFLATALNRYLGAHASPAGDVSELMARHVDPSMDIFYKGEHYHNGTGYNFDLYTVDDSLDEVVAFASQMAVYADDEDSDISANIRKRDWYDCQRLSNIQTLGCNIGHALGSFVSATGSAAFGGYLSGLLTEAFSKGRDNSRPRSVCLSRDKNNLCVSWAWYTGSRLRSGEANSIT